MFVKIDFRCPPSYGLLKANPTGIGPPKYISLAIPTLHTSFGRPQNIASTRTSKLFYF